MLSHHLAAITGAAGLLLPRLLPSVARSIQRYHFHLALPSLSLPPLSPQCLVLWWTPRPLAVMAQPLQVRRSGRNAEPLRSYADEQAYHRFQAQRDAEVARAIREVQATVEPSDSDESDLRSGDGSSSEDEKKASPRKENDRGWSKELHDVHPPLCDAIPTVRLPRDRNRSQLGYLQCFLNAAMIDTFVTQTNQYAIDRQASAWVPVTTEEMWRYLAVRIRQGIVVLPELHHYWEAGYRDAYISQLMT